MAGLVEEIQAKVLDKNVSTTELLRMVKLAAVKLQLGDAIEWVDHELKGYQVNEIEQLPPYRQSRGTLKAHTPYHGVQPIVGKADWIEDVSQVPIHQSLGEIEILAGKGEGEIISRLSGEQTDVLNEAFKAPGTEYYVHLPCYIFHNVGTQVRNLILDWVTNLERAGVLGEGISFTVEEKAKAAQNVPSIVNNYGHYHQGDVSGHQNRTVISSTDNSTNSLEIENTFQNLLQVVQDGVADDEHRKDLVEIIKTMQVTQGTKDYMPAFQKLVGYTAQYMTILGPFIPALGQLLA